MKKGYDDVETDQDKSDHKNINKTIDCHDITVSEIWVYYHIADSGTS